VLTNQLNLQDVKGTVVVNKAKISLQKTGFKLVGCKVVVDANYGSVNLKKFFFDTHSQASDFDIKRANNEVKLFHDMATAVGSAQGIISLDYTLTGKLDNNMQPVYPSLEGKGVMSVKNIQMKRFKLM
jgi:AsmA protein